MGNQSKTMAIVFLVLTFPFMGCATFRSDVEGRFDALSSKNLGAEKVNVLFLLRHVRQAKGLDAIPKLDSQGEIIRDFDDLFLDALNELSNLEGYATFTEFSSDVSQPERREKRDALISQSDFVIRIHFMRRHSFIGHFFGYLISTVSLTLLPVPYTRSFSVEVEVYDASENLLKKYSRNASLTMWVQTFLIFIQPFHQEKIKKEQIYIEFLHDIFKQIEAEKILTK